MGFDAIPSLNDILSATSAWVNPYFSEFSWIIGLSFGVACVIGVLLFLMNLFTRRKLRQTEYDHGFTMGNKTKISFSRIDDDLE